MKKKMSLTTQPPLSHFLAPEDSTVRKTNGVNFTLDCTTGSDWQGVSVLQRLWTQMLLPGMAPKLL